VRERLRLVFEKLPPGCIVSSAACGADLISLEMAGERLVRRLIVLPFERDRFRQESVADRGEDWGIRFDRVVDTIPPDDLIVLNLSLESSEAFAQTNRTILDRATSLARRLGSHPAAVVIWDGNERPGGDLTQAFLSDARSRGIRIEEVLTL
jgi:hypothetical protein